MYDANPEGDPGGGQTMPLTHQPAVGSLTLTTLRRGRGLEQEDLAVMSGRLKSKISAWENKEEPSWQTLVALCVDCMKYTLDEVEALYDCLSRIHGLSGREGTLPRIAPSPIPITEGELREIRRCTAPVGRMAMDAYADLIVQEIRATKVREAREAAEALCRAWLAVPAPRRRSLGPVDPALAWAVAECLAELSTKAAARSCQEALDLARLACRVARLAPGDRRWRARLRGFCLAFLANAWRVAGRIKKAQKIFRWAEALWNQGAEGDPDHILPTWRLFDLEASLRRGARDFPAALALLDRAKEVAPRAFWARILIKRACTLDAMFEAEQALRVLAEAAPLVDESTDIRLYVSFLSLECSNLCRLGRYQEAERALGSAFRIAPALGNELDVLRLRGLRGRVEAATGRVAAALESFQTTRRYFYREKMVYDFALASLEEAELRLKLGQFEQVTSMVARDMKWVFAAEGIHREALAALMLFRDAVEGRRATAELARRIHQYLERAQTDPALRFEE
jgi:tetratricopeptide (TPR) repeat protein